MFYIGLLILDFIKEIDIENTNTVLKQDTTNMNTAPQQNIYLHYPEHCFTTYIRGA